MYCRKCGEKLNENAKFCDKCGEKVVVIKQKTDSQKYAERREEEKLKKEKQEKKKTKREKKLEELKNPYILPAIGTAVIAFILGIFPYPKSWGIGTSLWMKIIILVIALLSDYHCTKARQMNNMYWNQYRYKVQENTVKVATVLAVITTMAAMFSLFTM